MEIEEEPKVVETIDVADTEIKTQDSDLIKAEFAATEAQIAAENAKNISETLIAQAQLDANTRVLEFEQKVNNLELEILECQEQTKILTEMIQELVAQLKQSTPTQSSEVEQQNHQNENEADPQQEVQQEIQQDQVPKAKPKIRKI